VPNLTLVYELRRIAEKHGDPRTRHLSIRDKELILQAAQELEDIERESRA
jgi:hypothetical protein